MIDNLAFPVSRSISKKYYHLISYKHFLQKKEIGPEDAEFAFPATVLKFIRTIIPGDIKGEIRGSWIYIILGEISIHT